MKIEFKCTGCGKCCTAPASSASGVLLTRSEARALEAAGHGWAINKVSANGWFLKLRPRPNSAIVQCVLLGQKGECRAYDARPVQCRSFPFWSVYWQEPGAWKLADCEGLNVMETA